MALKKYELSLDGVPQKKWFNIPWQNQLNVQRLRDYGIS